MLAKHPSTKRHTKPCKYFQTSRCSLSARECDFAHVLLDDMIAQPQNTICRYYAAGNCGNGLKCRYRHANEQSEERKAIRASDMSGIDMLHNQNPSVSIPPFHSSYHTTYSASPSSSWVPYTDSYPPHAYSPDAAPVAQFFKPGVISPSYSGDSSGSASSSTRSSLSDVAFITEDPKYNEHSHQYQSQIRIADERPVVHVNPYYPYKNPHIPVSPASPHPAHPIMHAPHILNPPVSPVQSPTRTRSRSNSRYKASNYKTKLCKFFSADGTCPKGGECTFIHDYEPVPKINPSITQNLTSPPGLPPKPISQQEENRKRNYFPVSWRVIGGGVLIGDPSHASGSQSGGSPEWPDGAEGDHSEVHANEQPNAYPGTVKTKSTGSGVKPARRPRSTSIPSSSRSAQVNMKLLFPAESPGSL